jgi:hypothetical protein
MFQTEVIEKIKTNILYSVTFSENRAVYEMWKNMADPDRPSLTILYNTAHALYVLDN